MLSKTCGLAAWQVLLTADPEQKAVLTHHAWQQHTRNKMRVGHASPPDVPARPSKPEVCPLQIIDSSMIDFHLKSVSGLADTHQTERYSCTASQHMEQVLLHHAAAAHQEFAYYQAACFCSLHSNTCPA